MKIIQKILLKLKNKKYFFFTLLAPTINTAAVLFLPEIIMELPLGIDQTGEWDLIRAIFSVAGPVGSHNIKCRLG